MSKKHVGAIISIISIYILLILASLTDNPLAYWLMLQLNIQYCVGVVLSLGWEM